MKGKNVIKVAGCCALALAFTLGSTACGGQKGDPETTPLYMSISQPDGVFNPFFSTSAYDGNIISMTQISMLATDKDGGILPRVDNGKVLDAENEPCVVKYWDSNFDASETTGDREEAGEGVTTYQFAIKNGIQFSDGVKLTIDDVLFNLYVYLDPAYTGSSTIYSTHILGLNAYRTQSADANDKTASDFEERANQEAEKKMLDLTNYVKYYGSYNGNDKSEANKGWTEDQKKTLDKYLQYVAAQFHQELENDWGTAVDSLESYKDWYRYDPATDNYIKWSAYTQKYGNDGSEWIIYLMTHGMTDLLKTRAGGNVIEKDDEGNCYIDPDAVDGYREELEFYCAENGLNPDALESQRLFSIETIYYAYSFEADSEGNVLLARCNSGMLEEILDLYSGWSTAYTVLNYLAAEWKHEQFAGQKTVPTIKGITTFKSSEVYGHSLGEECDILQIKIRGVDPKAIWNFAFTVAPLHYYSGVYNGKDYRNVDPANGEFGVELGDITFFQDVLNAPSKVGLPVGAGPYMASSASGNPATSGGQFFNNNIVYYERNPYFHTVGAKLEDAKIKYLRYRVVASDQIINSLDTGAVDIGDPNATTDNISDLNKRGIAHVEVQTAGYGYVGINPRYVPEINVRRAIMKAMNTALIFNNYYKGGLAEPIYRPMSKVSWAYPTGVGVYESTRDTYNTNGQFPALDGQPISYAYDSTGDEIEALLITAGYTGSRTTGWSKNISGFGTDTLDYKFTIAGGSTDHPAYAMFLQAQTILNRVGFKIKVVQSQTALSDLTVGKLTVWAAAWSSAIDPDMYQVYHVDSKASSVNNWGYPQILNNQRLYATEYAIIQELSKKIDEGRETDVQKEREDIYADALDLIMELAVEFPTYQRSDMTAYNSKKIDKNTLTPASEVGAYNGLISRIWEVNYR